MQEARRFSDGDVKAVLKSVVELSNLAFDGTKARCKIALLAECNTRLYTKLEKASAAGCELRKRVEGAKGQTKIMKMQLTGAGSALEKLASKAAQTAIDFFARVIVVDDLPGVNEITLYA